MVSVGTGSVHSDNRLKKDQVGGTSVDFDYDANGALIKDFSGQRFGYDAESHQKEFFSASNQTSTPDATYHFDGEGRRVKKVVGTEVTVFVYNASGQLVAEYSTTVVPEAQAKVSYLTADHLGSPRVITDQYGDVINRKDFSAFGEETPTQERTPALKYQAPNIRQDYTGYEKDGESGLEFAQARYYNPGHGRFTSVDPLTASASIRNPQTFNRYSYGLNSPYKFVDPLGLLSVTVGACGSTACANSGVGMPTDSGYNDINSNLLEQQMQEPPIESSQNRQITIAGGTQDQRDAVQNSIDTMKRQSPSAQEGFGVFEGKGDGYTLDITILNDEDFNALNKLNGGEENAQGITMNNGGGNFADPNAGENSVIYLKSSAIKVKEETSDRKANRETTLDAILGHELGHAYDISRNFKAWTSRNKEDRANKVDYYKRRNETYADWTLKWIAFERNVSSGVTGFKENLRFKQTTPR